MKITVMIPTFRRVASLGRCLEGLRLQERQADEVLVIIVAHDVESEEALFGWADFPGLHVIRDARGGQVNQLNSGIEACTGDILAVTDDDAVPQPQWLYQVERAFLENPDVGGVGGRDFVHDEGVISFDSDRPVGKVLWFGRVTGDHHLGARNQASIDILKGANMSYRRAAIGETRFDTDLRGAGAQTCNDMAFSLAIQKNGWRLLFDPIAAVDHYTAPRVGLEGRVDVKIQTIEDNAFNFYLALLRHMRHGPRRRMALLWTKLVGLREAPGSLRGLLFRLRGDKRGIEMQIAARRGWISAKHYAQP